MALFQEIQTPALKYEQPLGLFINNEFVPSVEGRTLDTINPHNEQKIAAVCEGTAKDVDIAVASARAAFEGPWKSLPSMERGKLLLKLADLLERDMMILANIEALDNGKTVSMAAFDIQGSANTLRYYGGWADKVYGQTIDIDENSHTYTRHEPLGLIAEAGFPPGVVNIINGYGRVAGAAIAWHMDVDKIAFTGSTLVGREIQIASAKSNLKKVTLELGGKSPNIVFADANIDNALSWVNFGIYCNHGQACCAGSRILVHEGIYETFLERFKQRAQQNKLGDPFAPDTFQGPQVSKAQFDRIMNYIDQGKAAGATLETGGQRYGERGYYIQPTIFSNVKEDMSIVREEIFGPVCTVQSFRDEDEAVRLANNTEYGLAAAVHTTNLKTATRMSNRLRSGTVWVNSYNLIHQQVPFGGYKQSGNGRELGSYALDNYTQVKAVRIYLGDAMFG
ncbi:Aldehyde/histidinol dehydrogenase [Aspergillus stella-maris]|uniref:Aldehyde/histidinol dehydrogenase n=1 Tax=Aspergillus stella-maris TaxID=1810926 RepID=UPI003CCD2112